MYITVLSLIKDLFLHYIFTIYVNTKNNFVSLKFFLTVVCIGEYVSLHQTTLKLKFCSAVYSYYMLCYSFLFYSYSSFFFLKKEDYVTLGNRRKVLFFLLRKIWIVKRTFYIYHIINMQLQSKYCCDYIAVNADK